MPLRFVLDEHLRGPLWRAIVQHNGAGVNVVDAVRVGDPTDLPLGTKDPDLLLWAEREQRLLITLDKTSLPTHLTKHLQSGRHSPGILVVRPGTSVRQVVGFLVLAAYATDPLDWQDQLQYIP